MIDLINRPEVFMRELHPVGGKGNVILKRKLGSKSKQSKVSLDDCEKIIKPAYGVEDLTISSSRFHGEPLLVNFVGANCIYVKVDWNENTVQELYRTLSIEGIPSHTDAIYDGKRMVFLWIFDETITQQDFYKIFLLQKGIYKKLSTLDPINDSLDLCSMIPQLGSISSLSGKFVSLPRHTGQKIDLELMEQKLLSHIGFSEHENLKRHACCVLELLALMHDRTFMKNCLTLVDDWLVFFGASLCHFCTEEQLVRVLKAITLCLTQSRGWGIDSANYNELINEIKKTAIRGQIVAQGTPLPVTYKASWFNFVRGKLNVTTDEIRRLKLSILAGDTSGYSKVDTSIIQAVGLNEFIPYERLLLKEVA